VQLNIEDYEIMFATLYILYINVRHVIRVECNQA